MIRRTAGLLPIVGATLVVFFLSAGFTRSTNVQRLSIPTQTRASGNLKISSAIHRLIAQGLARADFRQGQVDIQQGELRVFVEAASHTTALVNELRQAGATIELANEELGIVQARVPVSSLGEVAALEATRFIRLPDIGVLNAGSVTSQGDAVLRADDLRAEGFNGSGIKIGVISDGVFGLATSQASSDLPSVVTTRSFRADGDITAGLDPGSKGSEGTAMLEIIHDLAPGAQLFFANFLTSLEFIAAQDWLANDAGGNGVDIIVDDIAFFNVGAYDGSSAVSLNATDTLSAGVKAYVTSAGNQALRHYEADFVDSHPAIEGGFHDFAGFGASADEVLDLGILPNGQGISAFLQWSDLFGGSGNNYDLWLVQLDPNTGQFVGFLPAIGGQDVQDGNDNPTENLSYTNNTGGSLHIGLGIRKPNSAHANRHLDLFVFTPQPGNCTSALQYNTLESSVPNVADASNIMSVGAVYYSASPSMFSGTLTSTECFSSRGPTNDSRLKPEVVATDGVSTSVNNAGGDFTTFFGTSAAAPHVAAIATLLLDIKPSLSASQLRATV
ncbi:MAG: S8 family serine peptidase, partial [Deinococcus sp.]|nr:S8 family serine peptidase [Deinococcus sp.]